MIEEKGYRDEELPHPRTFQRLLNRLNYRLRRVQKTKPLKKIPETEAIFEHVAKAKGESDEREDSLRISIDSPPWRGLFLWLMLEELRGLNNVMVYNGLGTSLISSSTL